LDQRPGATESGRVKSWAVVVVEGRKLGLRKKIEQTKGVCNVFIHEHVDIRPTTLVQAFLGRVEETYAANTENEGIDSVSTWWLELKNLPAADVALSEPRAIPLTRWEHAWHDLSRRGSHWE
jgi:hypothetical protein